MSCLCTICKSFIFHLKNDFLYVSPNKHLLLCCTVIFNEYSLLFSTPIVRQNPMGHGYFVSRKLKPILDSKCFFFLFCFSISSPSSFFKLDFLITACVIFFVCASPFPQINTLITAPRDISF